MAYFEFHCTKGTGADPLNGGTMNTGNGQTYTDDGPCYQLSPGASGATAVDSGDYTDITDLSGDFWDTIVAAGDGGCFDPEGLGEHFVVNAVNGATITVTPQLTAAAEKGCVIGGAFADPAEAVTTIEGLNTDAPADAFSDGTPPKLNVKGDHELTATITPTASWTNTKPLVIQGYSSTPGDVPETRPVLYHALADEVVDLVDYDYLMFADLHIRKDGDNANVCCNMTHEIAAFVRCTFEATDGTGYVIYQTGSCMLIDCEIKNTGSASGILSGYSGGFHIGCTFTNGLVKRGYGAFVGCRFVDAYIDGIQQHNTIINCLVEPPTGQDGLEIAVADSKLLAVVNSIITGASAGHYGVTADGANVCCLFDLYNDYYGNDTDRSSNIANYLDGDGNISSDPDLDANDKPNAGSPVIGAALDNGDIGAVQADEPAGGGGMLQANKRGNKQ